jgi:hypothetical protein
MNEVAIEIRDSAVTALNSGVTAEALRCVESIVASATPLTAQAAGPATADDERSHQFETLNARWNKIAAKFRDSPIWQQSPRESDWDAWLAKLPFVVIYEDCLMQLDRFRNGVKTSGQAYLEMIVMKEGRRFLTARNLSRPKFVDDEDEQVVFIPRQK